MRTWQETNTYGRSSSTKSGRSLRNKGAGPQGAFGSFMELFLT